MSDPLQNRAPDTPDLHTLPAAAKQALPVIRRRLAASLVALYLHGSAVAGGLRPYSDVDLLAIVDRPLTPEVRRGLAADLMALSGRYPADPDGRRAIELIVFLRADLASPPYPGRAEFIYGEWLRDGFEKGDVAGPVSDAEFTLILAQSRQQAQTLFGPPAEVLLPAIARADVQRAIADALPTLIASLTGDERNVVLTLARMWYTSVNGTFVAKDVAADWAAERLPAESAALLSAVRRAYLNGSDDDWQHRQPALQRTVMLLREQISALR